MIPGVLSPFNISSVSNLTLESGIPEVQRLLFSGSLSYFTAKALTIKSALLHTLGTSTLPDIEHAMESLCE